MKLMIVDDHAGVRNMIRQFLAAPGDSFVECATGEAAVQAARDFRPDYVTMDVRLPDLSGLEAARAIRAALHRNDIPGMLSAVTDEMVAALAVAGTPDEVRRQLGQFEGLVDTVEWLKANDKLFAAPV